MKMINKAKENLESIFHRNDKIREEECVCMHENREKERFRMYQNDIIIASDDEYNLVRREVPSKPVMSSNKASTFPAEHKSDIE